jgi:hypothetical protein
MHTEMGEIRMTRMKVLLMTLATGAMALAIGGCSWGGGSSWIWRMLGDAVGDTAVYNIFLD